MKSIIKPSALFLFMELFFHFSCKKDLLSFVEQNKPIVIQTTCLFQQTLIGTLPVYRYSIKMATAGNKIVFAGGWELSQGVGSIPSSRVDIFDLITQTWADVDLNNHGGDVATIAVEDKIYFAGGTAKDLNGDLSATVDIYNTTNNTWTSTQLSEGRNGPITLKAGNKILFGGGNSGQSTTVDIYDLLSSSWTTANLQHGLYSGSALGNKAVFESYTSFDIYDASTNNWSIYAINGSYYNMAEATLGNKIYFAGGYKGGYGSNQFSDVVHIYDIISNIWSATKLSKPKTGMTAVSQGGKIFWAGGMDSIWYDLVPNEEYVRLVNDIEIYDLNAGSHSDHFFPQHTSFPRVGLANNQVLFTEGDSIHIYNSNLGTWTVCDAYLGWAPACISVGNKIYAAGRVGPSAENLMVWKLEF
ncbi:MAG: hypothetical protein ABIR66_11005 [Saprospiraceae bacterium]